MTDRIQRAIFKKLYLQGIWGGRHTDITNLTKGFPKHARGDVKKAVKTLIKTGYLTRKTTGYGMHIRLNVAKKKEIEECIGLEDD